MRLDLLAVVVCGGVVTGLCGGCGLKNQGLSFPSGAGGAGAPGSSQGGNLSIGGLVPSRDAAAQGKECRYDTERNRRRRHGRRHRNRWRRGYRRNTRRKRSELRQHRFWRRVWTGWNGRHFQRRRWRRNDRSRWNGHQIQHRRFRGNNSPSRCRRKFRRHRPRGSDWPRRWRGNLKQHRFWRGPIRASQEESGGNSNDTGLGGTGGGTSVAGLTCTANPQHPDQKCSCNGTSCSCIPGTSPTPDSTCNFACSASAPPCAVGCPGGGCKTECASNSSCRVDCKGANGNCQTICDSGSTCTLDSTNAGNCSMPCHGAQCTMTGCIGGCSMDCGDAKSA